MSNDLAPEQLCNQSPHDDRALRLIARESQMPVSEVTRLFEQARRALEAGARVRNFLSVFALRNVRETLRRRTPMASATSGADRERSKPV